ncbi:MAG: AtpZ/AtpI family protein [Candidatus Nanopelagicales bacterium]
MNEKTKTPALAKGEGLVWSVIGTLLSGPLVWGVIGAWADRTFDSSPRYLAFGLILGFVLSMYIVYVRYGREDQPANKNGGRS